MTFTEIIARAGGIAHNERATPEERAHARRIIAQAERELHTPVRADPPAAFVEPDDDIVRAHIAARMGETIPGRPKLVIGSGDRAAARAYLDRLGAERRARAGAV